MIVLPCTTTLNAIVSELSLINLFVCNCTDVGASDAADWAIARSLSALRSAEARGELSQPAKDGSSPPVSSSASIGEGSKGDRSV